MIVIIGDLELDALVVHTDHVKLNWGAVACSPLSADALRWVGFYMYNDIVEAIHEQSSTVLH